MSETGEWGQRLAPGVRVIVIRNGDAKTYTGEVQWVGEVGLEVRIERFRAAERERVREVVMLPWASVATVYFPDSVELIDESREVER